MVKGIEKLTHAYIQNIKRWMFGPANNTVENCKDCGKLLTGIDKHSFCEDCRKIRHDKWIARLKIGAKVAGVIGAVVGTVYLAAKLADDEAHRSENGFLPCGGDDDRNDGVNGMTCANCGNEDERTLWDEGDTFYCSKCFHRTRTDNGEDDVVECPYCHRMRDRKAMYCRYCNDTSWKASTKKEFREIDDLLKSMGD